MKGPGFHPFGIHIAGVCVTSRNVAKVSSDFRHTAGVCVLGCSVAKGSSFATKSCFGVGGSAILSTGDYRAFRSRADDTWGASPWESRSSPGNKQKAIS